MVNINCKEFSCKYNKPITKTGRTKDHRPGSKIGKRRKITKKTVCILGYAKRQEKC